MFKTEHLPNDWDWDDLRTILAVAEGGSLSAAARLMGTSHPTVYRRISHIEKRLGTNLFEKSATGYLPTNAGELAVEVARRISGEVDILNDQLGFGSPNLAGTIRMTCTDTVYSHLLMPMLAEFRRLYPEVVLEVLVSNDVVNLQNQDVDVALRFSKRSGQSLYSVKLGDVKMAVHAHTDHPVLKESPLHLGQHDWIGYDEYLLAPGVTQFLRDNDLERRIVFRANSLIVACEAVGKNIGLSLMPCYVGAALPNVKRVQAAEAELQSQLWAVSTRSRQRRPLIRTFFEFLQVRFGSLKGLMNCACAEN